MAAVPMARQSFPKGALIGILIGLIGAGIGIYGVLVNVGGFGLDTEADTGGICGKAAACCEKVSAAAGNKGSPDTCKNFKKIGVPEASCQMSYEQFKKTAETLKVTCE